MLVSCFCGVFEIDSLFEDSKKSEEYITDFLIGSKRVSSLIFTEVPSGRKYLSFFFFSKIFKFQKQILEEIKNFFLKQVSTVNI